MNKKQFKAEYSKWRALLGLAPDWLRENMEMFRVIHGESFELMCRKADFSIYYALSEVDYDFFSKPESRGAVLCNLRMNKESCEIKRIADRELSK